MTDRNVEHPNRYQLVLVAGTTDTFDLIPVPGTVLAEGTDINKAALLTDDTAEMLGLDPANDPAPDHAFNAITGQIVKTLVNVLRLKLQQALAASDIDAWSDLLVDATRINAGASSGYVLGSGKLTAQDFTVGQLFGNSDAAFGNNVNTARLGQTVTATNSGKLKTWNLYLKKTGEPSDNVIAKIYAEDKTTLLGTAAPIAGTSLTIYQTQYSFNFTAADVSITSGAVYFITLERSGGIDGSNCYHVWRSNSDVYAGGKMWAYNGTIWQGYEVIVYAADMDCKLTCSGTASVVWNAVTATEALVMMAVTADQTDPVTWYLSDDGTTWAEVTALDTLLNTAFDSTSVYLKCVFTGSAEVRAVAWGGY